METENPVFFEHVCYFQSVPSYIVYHLEVKRVKFAVFLGITCFLRLTELFPFGILVRITFLKFPQITYCSTTSAVAAAQGLWRTDQDMRTQESCLLNDLVSGGTQGELSSSLFLSIGDSFALGPSAS